ncbi:MAG: hypothetical protein H7145_04075 [Akkermansiaceae bacterium]|nr:hypothetical protein [Armatimonadota bacterium]
MQYRLLWGYANGGGSLWWCVGIAVGTTSALGYPAFVELWRTILLILGAVLCLSAPFVAVLATRAIQKRLERAKRKAKPRGPEYADYAYIL